CRGLAGERRGGAAAGPADLPMTRLSVPGSWRSRLERGAEYRQLCDARVRHVVRVDQPLVLISQAQRSGGTLLVRLLDAHPQCHVVPFQLRGIDEAAKRHVTDPERAWQVLHDPKLAARFRNGYRQVKHGIVRDGETYPFLLPPGLQRSIYDACVGSHDDPGPREILDCYFTSYFNAWLDYRN